MVVVSCVFLSDVYPYICVYAAHQKYILLCKNAWLLVSLRRFDPLATRILLRMSMKWAKKVDDPRFFFEFHIRILKVTC